MAKPILIIGNSGSGKSHSLQNLPTSSYALINVMGKELPFKTDKKYLTSTNYADIKQALINYASKIDLIVIDDAGYLITEQFMLRANEKGYEKFSALANDFWQLIRFISLELPSHVRVYLTMHEDRDENNYVKPKTIGRMLDEKLNIAGLFGIVLNAQKKEGKYIFRTQTDGYDVTKSPEGMFDGEEIANDLKTVDDAIKKYYNLGGSENAKN